MGITIIQNPSVPLVLVDSKGDMFVATGDDTVARLGVGADGTVLTADSIAEGGVAWVSPDNSLGAASGDTDDLNEGVSNLFFTDARKQSAEIASLFFFS
jgi:UDP-N-acetylmuramyl tripeptide synthase